ncbi:hypothetical protein F7725_012747 [Dissostichus mawsoni]|uniref:Uncharacterized protein n=1 Tax=Dissostichus mawsoni TaxID=36200 RepID=A0A7J5YNJ0_DISMA|nr:hypothetical protein F7725_012747 [Dissostichus mawsoni]
MKFIVDRELKLARSCLGADGSARVGERKKRAAVGQKGHRCDISASLALPPGLSGRFVVRCEHGETGHHLLNKDKELSWPQWTAAAGNNRSWRGKV